MEEDEVMVGEAMEKDFESESSQPERNSPTIQEVKYC
jgi:hypothetical protein